MADGWGESVVAQNQPPADAGWGTATNAQPPQEKPEKPMPGFFEALGQGAQAGLQDIEQTLTAFSSAPPKPIQEESAAAEPYEWRDLYEPSRGLAKTGYAVSKGLPTLGSAFVGSGLGGLLGPGAARVGGIAGSAAGAAAQTLGPEFARELQQSPQDPDGAWDRAVRKAEISGAFAGAGWAAFGIPFFNGPVKQLAFQAIGVQPAINMGQRAATNVVEDKPLTEGLGQAYVQGAIANTAGTALTHVALRPGNVSGTSMQPITQRTPAQDAIHQSAQNKFMQADLLDQAASGPHLTTDQVYQMRTQAEMTRQEAQHETFLSNIPPQVADPGVVKGTIFRNFLPELTSDKALQTAPRFGEYASSRAQNYDSILARADHIRNAWDWVPFDDVKRWFDVYETRGSTLPPDLVAKYPFMQRDMATLKKWLNQAYFDESDVGSRAEYVMEYFPHLFKRPDAVKQMFSNIMTPGTAGATWFQKARYYDLITQALNNGLELKTNNPVDLVSWRLMSGADMRAKMSLLQDLNTAGVATPVKDAPGALLNTMRMPSPWKEINAPNGTKWLLAPDVQNLWENAVVSKGLWADPGIMGRTFRGWMALKAAWVPIKLGASLFHPVHVSLINLSNNVTRALHETFAPGQQGIARRITALPQAAAQSVLDLALAFPIGTPHLGKEIRKAWQQTPSTWTPRQQYLMDLYRQAGASPQISEQLRSQGDRTMQQAMANTFGPDRTAGQRALAGASLPYQGIKKLAGYISKPFFEHWIPNLKAAALTREAEALFRRRPDIMNDPAKMKVALNAIGKQVDNRFGEMFYGSLFWNRTIKDASIGAFLSLGWNLGFAREFVGGALEPAARRMMAAPTPTRSLIRDVTTKSTNLMAYTMAAMALNAAVNKYFTGEDAQGMDYIFPRIGGTNTDGTQRRLSTPHYTREVPMAEKNIEDQGGNVAWGLTQMLWHKLMFAPVMEAFQNKDYFGGQIYDQNAPAYKQAKQFFTHLLTDQINPMSVSGAQRALELSGKPKDWRSLVQAAVNGDRDVWLPFLGYGPAPSYASRSALENRINALGRQFIYPNEKPFQENENFRQRLEAMTAFKQAQQRQDRAAMGEAAQKMATLGMSGPQIMKTRPEPSSPKTFQRLPESQQVNLLKGMTKDEFKVYYPKASKKTKADPAVIPLALEYYRRP